MALVDDLIAALASPNVQAFLRVIRAGESSQDDDAYRVMFGGSRFESFADHPRRKNTAAGLTSTAAGAYQFLSKTWDECRAALELRDFSPRSQDLAALYLIRRRGALADVLAGYVEAAIEKCSHEWASLPGSPYGQPTMTLAKALAVYRGYGGRQAAADGWADTAPASPSDQPPTAAPSAPGGQEPEGSADAGLHDPHVPVFGPGADGPQPEPAMPLSFLAAAIPALIQHAPQLIRLFGSGGQVTERNAKAAEVVGDIAKLVTEQTTVEGAVQVLQSDPKLAAVFREEVHQNMGELLGHLIQAGEFDERTRATALDRNLELGRATGGRWLYLLGAIAVIVVLVSYGITAGVLFSAQTTFSDETKALLLGQIVIFGFVTVLAFLFGSNLQNRIAASASQQRARSEP